MSHVGRGVFEMPMYYPASDVQDAVCFMSGPRERDQRLGYGSENLQHKDGKEASDGLC